MIKVKTLFILFLCFNYKFILGQQIDTVIVNNSVAPFKIVSTIDTIMLNKYLKGYVLKMTVYSLRNNNPIQVISDTNEVDYSIKNKSYFDINLDGYKDINVTYEDSYGTQSNSFWLYDSTTKCFKYSNDFGLIGDIYSFENTDEKIIRTYDSWYPGMVCRTMYRYKIEGFRLKLIEEEGCGKFNEDSYYFYNKKLLNDTVRMVELDSLIHSENEYIKKSYRFTDDSLLLTYVYWANDKEAKFTDSSNAKIYFETEFTGALKCKRKEEYTYLKNDRGQLVRKIKRYVVQNDRWVLKE